MKKGIIAFAALAVVAIGAMAFGTAEKGSDAKTTYQLDAKASTIKWVGRHTEGDHSHFGSIKLSEGTVVFAGDKFESGNFSVDMNTIMAEDIKGAMRDTLNAHLSGPYFFLVKKFPTTKVTINEVTATEIKATLNVVGKDVPAVIPVTMKKDGKKIVAIGKFKLDIAAADIAGFKPHDAEKPNAHISPVFDFDVNIVLAAK